MDKKILALFFTTGVSLATWERVGNLERELKPYRELAKHFKQIYFFTYGGKTDLKFQKALPENIKIFPKKYPISSKIYGFFLPFFYRKELGETDVLKTNQMNGSWAAVIAKKLYGKKLVVRCGFEWLRFSEKKKRNAFMKWLVALLEKIAYHSADKIILPTEDDKQFVVKTFRVPAEKIEVIPNYIDTDHFRPLPAERGPTQAMAWARLAPKGAADPPLVQKEKGRIITVAKLEKQKNLASLIEAVSGIPDAKLVIIGSGSLRKRLEDFAKEKGANVEFKGNIPQKDLPQELNKSEIFVLPSFYEGSPKALLEAMSCGLPCIGANVDGINTTIRHEENGYLCGTDSKSMQEALRKILEGGFLQKKIGEAARQTIIQKYSFEKLFSQERELYRLI